MAKPVGLKSALKDNSKKKWREHDEWMIGKKIGRPKQQWNPNGGYWEKVTA